MNERKRQRMDQRSDNTEFPFGRIPRGQRGHRCHNALTNWRIKEMDNQNTLFIIHSHLTYLGMFVNLYL